jgi:hypothetical protein
MPIEKQTIHMPDGFRPIIPQPDTEELAANGKRIIMYYRMFISNEIDFVEVPKGELHAGWVIAIERCRKS